MIALAVLTGWALAALLPLSALQVMRALCFTMDREPDACYTLLEILSI